MNVWTIDRIIIFLFLFIPGFISIKVYDLFVSREPRDFSKSIPEVMGYSALNFVFFSWLLILIHTGNFVEKYFVWYLIIIFIIGCIFPIIWPIIFFFIRKSHFLQKYTVHPILKPWDFVFGKREPYWVVIHLKNGDMICGKYGYRSFSSSYPAPEQIYLEEVWYQEDGVFTEPVDRSAGIIVMGDEIRAVEFMEYLG